METILDHCRGQILNTLKLDTDVHGRHNLMFTFYKLAKCLFCLQSFSSVFTVEFLDTGALELKQIESPIPNPPNKHIFSVQNQYPCQLAGHIQGNIFTIQNTFHQNPCSQVLYTFQVGAFWICTWNKFTGDRIFQVSLGSSLYISVIFATNTPTWYKLGTESRGNMSSHRTVSSCVVFCSTLLSFLSTAQARAFPFGIVSSPVRIWMVTDGDDAERELLKTSDPVKRFLQLEEYSNLFLFCSSPQFGLNIFLQSLKKVIPS